MNGEEEGVDVGEPLGRYLGNPDTDPQGPMPLSPQDTRNPMDPPDGAWQQEYIKRFQERFGQAPTWDEIMYAWRIESGHAPTDLNGDLAVI